MHLFHNHDARVPCDLVLLIIGRSSLTNWEERSLFDAIIYAFNNLSPVNRTIGLYIFLGSIWTLSTRNLMCVTFSQFLSAIWINDLSVQIILIKKKKNYDSTNRAQAIAAQSNSIFSSLFMMRKHPFVHCLWWVMVVNNYSPPAMVFNE